MWGTGMGDTEKPTAPRFRLTLSGCCPGLGTVPGAPKGDLHGGERVFLLSLQKTGLGEALKELPGR